MNTTDDAVPEVLPTAPADHAVAKTRPLYWSVRRELWENRSITIGPLIVAVVILVAVLLSTIGLPHRRRAVLALSPAQQQQAIQMPYDAIAGMLVLTAFFVGIFYCSDALHGERRDRTILFWKSMPVSDRTTVLAKAGIPLVVLPLYTLALIFAGQLLILAETTALLVMSGATPAMLRLQLMYTMHPLDLLYAFSILVLWHAPVYTWFLLVSGWARRAAFLWAVLPFFALAIFERIAFRTSAVGRMLGRRTFGWFAHTFARANQSQDPLAFMTPAQIVLTIVVGLLFAAVFVAAAVRLRRNREPI